MTTQLDILALEPFYGGARRHMLETVIRCSRHRWTLLKLPPRRIERRLTAAANWFAEQLSRHWSGRIDVLFTSEAMNLASLYRLAPNLARPPSVVYFHDNQIPPPGSTPPAREQRPKKVVETATLPPWAGVPVIMQAPPRDREPDLELVNLNTATAATEIWFNSAAHQRAFLTAARQLVDRHPELSSHDPMPEVQAKSVVMPPPLDLNLIPYVKAQGLPVKRDPRAIFVDTRDGQVRLLNAALAELASRGEAFRLITVGPVEDLNDRWPRNTLGEGDDLAHAIGVFESAVILSIRPGAPCDLQVIRGLQAGCRPVLPDQGVYPELIPSSIGRECLYQPTVDSLADHLQEAVNPTFPWNPPDCSALLKQYEAISATRLFDDRLTQLAVAAPMR